MALFCSRCRNLLGAEHCAGCGGRIRIEEGARCRVVEMNGKKRVVHVHATDCCDERAERRARRGRPLEAFSS